MLHRYPTISPDPPQWEVDYEKMKDKIENMNRAVRYLLSSSLRQLTRVVSRAFSGIQRGSAWY